MKKLSYQCVLFFSFFVLTSALAQQLPSSPSTPSPSSTETTHVLGTQKVKVSNLPDLMMGQFSTGITLPMAPARQGFSPAVNCIYNSAYGNDVIGQGWDLGLLSISRSDPRVIDVSGVKQYKDTGYILNIGAHSYPLVNISGNVYYPKINPNLIKLTHNGYWTLTTKSGIQIHFGQSSNSRLENQNLNTSVWQDKTLSWFIDQSIDLNNNQITWTYTTDNNRHYVTQIDYNENVDPTFPLAANCRITFEYENRSDVIQSNTSGINIKVNKRLKSMSSWVNGTLVNKLILKYIYSPTSNNSLLSEVRLYGSDGLSAQAQSLSPKSFAYNDSDFLETFDNGLSGIIEVDYKNIKVVTNGIVYFANVVDSVTSKNGMGNSVANTYGYTGGYYDKDTQRFLGFNEVESVDPSGSRTINYFNQGLNGDTSKEGFVEKVEVYGSDGLLYQTNFFQVDSIDLTNGSRMPYTRGIFGEDYGDGNINNTRSVGSTVDLDPSTGNILSTNDYGEIKDFDSQTYGFTDVGTDDLYTQFAYVPSATIVNLVQSITRYADSQKTKKLTETKFEYDSQGNVIKTQQWNDQTGNYIDDIFEYNAYGNLEKRTDAVGLVLQYSYDATQTFNTQSRVDPTGYDLTATTNYLPSGELLDFTSAAGVRYDYEYDVYHRLIKKSRTSIDGLTTQWLQRMFYQFDGINQGVSQNRLHIQINDSIDPVNGHEMYIYYDAWGRVVQKRIEAENNQFRVVNYSFNQYGQKDFTSFPTFQVGSSHSMVTGQIGFTTLYDQLNRPYSSVPPTSTEVGSPVATDQLSYSYNGDPWTLEYTDRLGNTTRSFYDARGNLIRQEIDTVDHGIVKNELVYDELGRVIEIKDNQNNKKSISYDSLGNTIVMNQGTLYNWVYKYNDRSQVTEVTDAKNNKITLDYDLLGRITKRDGFISGALLPDTSVRYVYDASPGRFIPSGYLAEVIDDEGSEKYDYDQRFAYIIEKERTYDINQTVLITKMEVDVLGRLIKIDYPNDEVEIEYRYDNAGHLEKIVAVKGADTPNKELVSYDGFTVFDQPQAEIYGNGVRRDYSYYLNGRLKQVVTKKIYQVIQDYVVNYNSEGFAVSVIDNRRPTGPLTGTVTNIQYTETKQYKSYDRDGKTYDFTYDDLGRLTYSSEYSDASGGDYFYDSNRPYLVEKIVGRGSSPTRTYDWDNNANLEDRSGQKFKWNSINQLVEADHVNGQGKTQYGYSHSGSRLFSNDGQDVILFNDGLYAQKNTERFHYVRDHSGNTICILKGKNSSQSQTGGDSGVQQHSPPPSTSMSGPILNGGSDNEQYLHNDVDGNTNVVTSETGSKILEKTFFKHLGEEKFTYLPPPREAGSTLHYTVELIPNQAGYFYEGPDGSVNLLISAGIGNHSFMFYEVYLGSVIGAFGGGGIPLEQFHLYEGDPFYESMKWWKGDYQFFQEKLDENVLSVTNVFGENRYAMGAVPSTLPAGYGRAFIYHNLNDLEGPKRAPLHMTVMQLAVGDRIFISPICNPPERFIYGESLEERIYNNFVLYQQPYDGADFELIRNNAHLDSTIPVYIYHPLQQTVHEDDIYTNGVIYNGVSADVYGPAIRNFNLFMPTNWNNLFNRWKYVPRSELGYEPNIKRITITNPSPYTDEPLADFYYAVNFVGADYAATYLADRTIYTAFETFANAAAAGAAPNQQTKNIIRHGVMHVYEELPYFKNRVERKSFFGHIKDMVTDYYALAAWAGFMGGSF